MATRICPECQGKVSDTLKACPHCGFVMNQTGASMPPVPPVSPANQNAQGGIKTELLTCPGCGSPLSSKDIISSEFAHCSLCGADIHLAGGKVVGDGILEKIFPFGTTKDKFHELCILELMKHGEEDVFRNASNFLVEKKYIWVREFGAGNEREVYPMCEYGVNLFRAIGGRDTLSLEKYGEWWPMSGMRNVSSDIVEDAVILEKDYSPSECKHLYETYKDTKGYKASDRYYCFPVFEETFDYKGQKYCFKGVGDNAISWHIAEKMPESKFLTSKPKYTDMVPVTALLGILVAAVLLIAVISVFADSGFWLGLLILVVAGAILYIPAAFVGTIAFTFTMGIDTVIQKSINAGRRSKFRAEYKRIQEQKQKDAMDIYGMELPCEVPEFPIP